jgi:quercetin dioxygenase-like cupin family protein
VLGPEEKGLSAAEADKRAIEGFKAIGGEHCRVDATRHPGMHKTRTVDYIVLLEGDVTLILEKEEVRLKKYDVVVQRGTNHAWRNNLDTPAILAGVLIDAAPV